MVQAYKACLRIMHAKFQCSIMNTLEDMSHVYLKFFVIDRRIDRRMNKKTDGQTDERVLMPPLTFVKHRGHNLYL